MPRKGHIEGPQANPDTTAADYISGATFCKRLDVIVRDFKAQCVTDKKQSPWQWICEFRAFMRSHPYGEP